MEGAWRVHRGCIEGAWRMHGGCLPTEGIRHCSEMSRCSILHPGWLAISVQSLSRYLCRKRLRLRLRLLTLSVLLLLLLPWRR